MRKLKTWELGRKSVEEFHEAQKLPIVIILDNIRSAYNVGAVFRTADAFLVESVILCGHTSRPPHPEIYKTALGAEDSINWEYEKDVIVAVQKLKSENYTLMGIEQTDNSVPLNEWLIGSKTKYALIFGNEVDGVNDEVLKQCDIVVEIPMYGTKHSLNISVAAGVVMWEVAKGLIGDRNLRGSD